MSAAYIDTSCLVAIAFDEPGGREVAERLEEFDLLLSSNLLEAELRSAFAGEEVAPDPSYLSRLAWALPDRPLGPELERVLHAGYLRGADAWHLATALYLVESATDLPFLTLDTRQQEIAAALGFPTPLQHAADPP